MKKIVLILLMTLGVFASGDIVSEECKVDMYYANGIMMQDSEDETKYV